MTPEQIAYVASRRRQIRYWPWLALILVLLLAASYGWLWQNAPLNINPFLVLEQFHHRTVSEEDMIMLAARGSLALVTCGLFLLFIIFLLSVALLNERRLIGLLDQMTVGSAAPVQTGASGPEAEAVDAGALPEEAGVDAMVAGQRPGERQVVADPALDGEPPARHG